MIRSFLTSPGFVVVAYCLYVQTLHGIYLARAGKLQASGKGYMPYKVGLCLATALAAIVVVTRMIVMRVCNINDGWPFGAADCGFPLDLRATLHNIRFYIPALLVCMGFIFSGRGVRFSYLPSTALVSLMRRYAIYSFMAALLLLGLLYTDSPVMTHNAPDFNPPFLYDRSLVQDSD